MIGVKSLAGAPFRSSLAACRGVDAELFYPDRGVSTAEAKDVCKRCPVRAACLEFALVNVEKFGIWGGTSERERRRLRRERGIAETRLRPPCGTKEGYDAHARYREDRCQPCKDAYARWHNALNVLEEHGDTCRCYECQRINSRQRYLRVVS